MGLQTAHSRHQLQPCAHGPLGVVLMGLGVTEVDQHPIPHVLRHEPAEALHGLGNTLLVAADNLAEVFRFHVMKFAVPTRSQ